MAILTAAGKPQSSSSDRKRRPQDAGTDLDEVVDRIRHYAAESPEKFALACLGIGFVLGWKLKPW